MRFARSKESLARHVVFKSPSSTLNTTATSPRCTGMFNCMYPDVYIHVVYLQATGQRGPRKSKLGISIVIPYPPNAG